MLARLVLSSLAIARGAVACSNTPDAVTANEPCSAYIATDDATHRAVTEHIGAVQLAIWTDAKAPPGQVHITAAKRFIGKMNDAQLKAAEQLSTAACRLSPSSSVLYAVTSGIGSRRIEVPAALQP